MMSEEISRLSALAMWNVPEAFFIYKLTIVPTGQFYIGFTENMITRVDFHSAQVLNAIKKRQENPNFEHATHLYDVASRVLFVDKFNSSYEKQVHLKKNLKMDILAVVSGKKHALALEKQFIAFNYNDDLNLNVGCILNTPDFADDKPGWFVKWRTLFNITIR